MRLTQWGPSNHSNHDRGTSRRDLHLTSLKNSVARDFFHFSSVTVGNLLRKLQSSRFNIVSCLFAMASATPNVADYRGIVDMGRYVVLDMLVSFTESNVVRHCEWYVFNSSLKPPAETKSFGRLVCGRFHTLWNHVVELTAFITKT